MRGGLAVAIVASMLTACASPPPAAPPPREAAAPEPAPAPEPPPPPAPEAPPAAAEAPEEKTYSVGFLHGRLPRPPEPIPIEARGDFRQEASGAVFPERVGDIRRVGVTQYDTDGRDVGAGYQCETDEGAVVLSAYVYPGPRLVAEDPPAEVVEAAWARMADQILDQEIATIQRSYAKHDEPSTVVSRTPIVVRSAGVEHRGTRVDFQVRDPFGKKGETGTSYLHLFPRAGGEWMLKVRTTLHGTATGSDAVERLLSAVTWPAAPR